MAFSGHHTAPLPHTITLSAPAGAGKIRVWKDNRKTERFTLGNPLDIDTDTYYLNLYVEGVATSGGIRDVTLKATYARGDIDFVDEVKLTVVDVVVDEPATAQIVPVLISKTPGMGDQYPAYPLQSVDRKARIKAHTQPRLPDIACWFRTYDPDDESPYETEPGPDNADGTGTLLGVPGYVSDPCGNDLIVYSNSSGEVEFDLRITDHCSGDNYVVAASANSPPDASDDASGTLVAWKRVYYELDSMYEEGTDLTEDYDNGFWGEPYLLHVADPTLFSQNQEIMVFDADYPEGETATVSAVDVGDSTITLSAPLSRCYNAGYEAGDKGAAVTFPACATYQVDVFEPLREGFGSDIAGRDGGGFVEFLPTPDGQQAVPHEAGLSGTTTPDIDEFFAVWCKNRSESNVFHVVAAERAEIGSNHGWGLTSWLWSNCSVVFIAAIDAFYGSDATAARKEVVVHETGHQFMVSPCDDDPEHFGDPNHAGTDQCVMSYDPWQSQWPHFRNGIVEFCTGCLYDIRRCGDGL